MVPWQHSTALRFERDLSLRVYTHAYGRATPLIRVLILLELEFTQNMWGPWCFFASGIHTGPLDLWMALACKQQDGCPTAVATCEEDPFSMSSCP